MAMTVDVAQPAQALGAAVDGRHLHPLCLEHSSGRRLLPGSALPSSLPT